MSFYARYIPEADILETRPDDDHGLTLYSASAFQDCQTLAESFAHPWTWCLIKTEEETQ